MTEQTVDRPRQPHLQEDAPPPRSDFGRERGVPFILPFSIPYRDQRSWEVLQEDDGGPTVRQLQAMRRHDGQARGLYRLISLPMRSAVRNMHIVPESGGDQEAEFVKTMLNLPASAGGMVTSFDLVMAQIFMAVFDGFEPFEQVFWSPLKGPLKGKVTLKKLAHRPPETVTFLVDRYGDLTGLRQQTMFQGQAVDVSIPANRVFYYAAQEEERAFYGVSYFQSAFDHYDWKTRLYYVMHLAAQRAAVGTRVGRMPANASNKQKNDFYEQLANLGLAQWMALPGAKDQWDVELMRDVPGFDFLSLVNHHNSMMSKSVLAQFFDQNQGGGSSDTAVVNFAEGSDDFFVLMLMTILNEVADRWNTLVFPKLIDWNFASSKYPKMRFGPFTDKQKQVILETFARLATAGLTMNVTPQFMFQLEQHMAAELGLPIDYQEIEEQKQEEDELRHEAALRSLEEAASPQPDRSSSDNSAEPPNARPEDRSPNNRSRHVNQAVSRELPGRGSPPSKSRQRMRNVRRVGDPDTPLSAPQDPDILDLAQQLLDRARHADT